MPLRLVPPKPPSAKQAVIERVKRQARPNGALQCPRCGCRSSVTIVAGAFIKNGRVQGGTVIAKHDCEECHKQGIHSSMLPELKAVD